MRIRLNTAIMIAFILCGGAIAQAGFTYSSVPSPGTTAFGGSDVVLSTVNSSTTLSVPTLVNIADVALTSTTVPPATDTTSISFSDVVTITNVPTPGTSDVGAITVTGTLAFTRSDTGGEISTFTPGSFTPSATIGGVLYTISNLSYSAPTVNNVPVGDGNISALISSSVPEPGCASLLVAGMVGILSRRRV